MVEVKRNEEMEKEVYDACRKMLGKKREGIHVSDLLSPRRAFLAHMYGNRTSDKQVGMFIAGIAHHGIIESLVASWGDREVKGNMEGIFASIDCFRKDHPVEVKTSRAWKVDKLSENYIDQLKMYCVMTGIVKGHVLIFYLNVSMEIEQSDGSWESYRGPKIICYDVDFTEDELKEKKADMINNRNVLDEAKRTGDGTKLPKCPAKWMCADCGYKVECKEIDKPKEIKVEGCNLTFTG